MITQYRNKLENLKGKREAVLESIEQIKSQIKKEKKNVRNAEDSLIIIQEVAKQTQSKLEYHLTEIVNLALISIFDESYNFGIEFIVKRNKTECELFLLKDGERIDPITASGGGVVDIISFSLRLALWTLQNPRNRNCILMDEPMKFVSKDLLSKVSDMLKMLSEKLNLQMIIVTHLNELIEAGNKIFNVNIKNKISEVKEI